MCYFVMALSLVTSKSVGVQKFVVETMSSGFIVKADSSTNLYIYNIS